METRRPPEAGARAADHEPTGQALLRLFAVLAPAPFDRALFCTEAAAEVLRALATHAAVAPAVAPLAPEAALDRLAAAGLLAASVAGDGTPVLRAGPAAVDAAAPSGADARQLALAALRIVDACAPEAADDPQGWALWRRLRPHVERVLEFAERHSIADATGPLTARLGVFVCAQGERARAEQLFRRALAIDEAHSGPRHAQVARDLVGLSVALDRPETRDESEVAIARAVAILLDQEQEQPACLAGALHVFAGVVLRRGLRTDAELVQRFALELDERHLGPGHPAVARDLRALASLWLALDRHDEAAPMLARALAIDERDSVRAPAVAADLRLLASALARNDPAADTVPLLERAAAIDEHWHGVDSGRAIEGRIELASAWQTRRRQDHAQRELQEAVHRVCRATTVDPGLQVRLVDHVEAHCRRGGDFDVDLLVRLLAHAAAHWRAPPSVLHRLHARATAALRGRRRWHEARALHLAGEESRLRARVAEAPGDARAWNELALFLKNDRPDYDESERCYRRSVELVPANGTYLFNLGLFLTRVRGRHDEAEPLLRRAVGIATGDANVLSGLAFFLHHVRGQASDADELYARALGLAPREASLLTNVASLRLLQGRTAEARALLDASAAAEPETDITLRTLFLGAVAARLAGADASAWIARLQQLLFRAITAAPWHPRAVMAELPRRLPAEEARFYGALQAFLFPMSGRTVAAPELEEFAPWGAAAAAARETAGSP